MTRYKDEVTFGDDFDDQIRDQKVVSYREGVERVAWFLNDWDGEGQLIADIREAIEEGII